MKEIEDKKLKQKIAADDVAAKLADEEKIKATNILFEKWLKIYADKIKYVNNLPTDQVPDEITQEVDVLEPLDRRAIQKFHMFSRWITLTDDKKPTPNELKLLSLHPHFKEQLTYLKKTYPEIFSINRA